MFKKIAGMLLGGFLSVSMCFTSFAAWVSDGNGWWFDNGNGTWPASCWLWVDGNQDGQAECYYFQQNGYIMLNSTTPDGYIVDASGAWVVDGVVQKIITLLLVVKLRIIINLQIPRKRKKENHHSPLKMNLNLIKRQKQRIQLLMNQQKLLKKN